MKMAHLSRFKSVFLMVGGAVLALGGRWGYEEYNEFRFKVAQGEEDGPQPVRAAAAKTASPIPRPHSALPPQEDPEALDKKMGNLPLGEHYVSSIAALCISVGESYECSERPWAFYVGAKLKVIKRDRRWAQVEPCREKEKGCWVNALTLTPLAEASRGVITANIGDERSKGSWWDRQPLYKGMFVLKGKKVGSSCQVFYQHGAESGFKEDVECEKISTDPTMVKYARELQQYEVNTNESPGTREAVNWISEKAKEPNHAFHDVYLKELIELRVHLATQEKDEADPEYQMCFDPPHFIDGEPD